MREPNCIQEQRWSNFAVNVTSSLRKGLPTSQVPKSLKRKEDSFQFPFHRVAVSLRCRAISHNWRRFGILTKFPFAGRNYVWKTINSRSRALAFRLGATHPCPIAVHMEPFSTSVFKGYTWIVATSTKICTRCRSTPFCKEMLPHLTSTPPYFLFCLFNEKKKRRISLPLERHPFSGQVNSVG